jgi:hypothetical protein
VGEVHRSTDRAGDGGINGEAGDTAEDKTKMPVMNFLRLQLS